MKHTAHNKPLDLASVGVYVRGKFCGNLKACRPNAKIPKRYRQAARQ